MKMKNVGLKTNLALSTIYQILAIILPLATAPYVSRVLGVDNIGIYSYTHSYLLFFSMFAALGTVSYGTREIARNRNNRERRSQLFWEIAVLTIITTTVVIIAWGCFAVFQNQYKKYYAILTVALIATMFDISWLYAGLEQFKYTVAQNLLFKIIGVLAIFAFVKEKEDLWKYILILSLTQTLANLTMWIYLPKFIDKIPIRSIHIGKHFKETLVYFVPTIAISIYTILDKTLIGLITHDTSENGNYEQATKIINISKTMSFVGVNMVLQSRIAYLFTEKKYREIKERISVSIDYVSFISVGIVFGIIGVADRFVPLFFGKGYDKTVVLMRYMAPIVLIVGVSNCLGSQYYNPAGLRAKSARYIVAGSLINLFLNLLLIPRFNSEGAVLATLIAETSISILYLKNCDGFYTLKQLAEVTWKKIMAGSLMLGIILFEGNFINNSLFLLIFQIGSGVLSYSIILLILKDTFIVNTVMPQLKKALSKRII